MKRAKGELVGAIYEKALKRKDITGAVARSKLEAASNTQDLQGNDGKVDKPKTKTKKATVEVELASADIGKIVSLIATDATKVSMTITFMPVSRFHDALFCFCNNIDVDSLIRYRLFGLLRSQRIYEAPVQIILACVMLYKLMGYSAFVGYIVLLLALPINHLLIKKTTDVQTTLLGVRDKRMRVMNEAIQSIKVWLFVRFFVEPETLTLLITRD